MKKKIVLGLIVLIPAMVLAACSGNEEGTESNGNKNEEASDSMEGMDHAGMDHSSSGEVPEDLERAENPSYPVDSEATINANHMGGMDGAVATITGAYETTVYTVSYTPTTGGASVEDHKWVIHEEIKNAGEKPFEAGDEVVLNADHMEGMDGATATINSAEQTIVYMVSYTDTETGNEVTNHKWVTESELSPVE
ncbi:YdhK family protein [Virgibacillus sp. NKC19-3]|uniref:YdhK family protein n=1 Tax=Virgibacillus saliphilus TaxID=2831674 RepID=UPI001C9AA712|nr:YdhK family protein [Virgibacillus sp. NKC19-3]MBY7141992.1 YdhK family protein [Virgibacillus sp. NKC19-3]